MGRPRMMLIVAVAKGDDETSVSNSPHRREYPLRDERSRGPLRAPIWRRNRCFPPLDLALSSCSRTSRPMGTPVTRDVSFSHARSSSVRRIVSVLPILNNRNTHELTSKCPLLALQRDLPRSTAPYQSCLRSFAARYHACNDGRAPWHPAGSHLSPCRRERA